MSGPSPIEWTDATWNVVGGCSIKSPGCINCYAQKLAGTRLARLPLYAGTTTPAKGKPVFNGHLTVAPDDAAVWTWPLRWRGSRAAKAEGRLSRIFVGDMSDLFHEDRPLRDIIRTIAVAVLCRHTVQILTKRPDRLRALMLDADFVHGVEAAMADIAPAHRHDREIDDCGGWPNPRLWLGFSAERQVEFNDRWPFVRELAQAGWTIYVSIEPMLGPVVLPADFLAFGQRVQIIVGGESGGNARPMNPQWARDIRDQCIAAGVAYFHKQNGEYASVSEVEGPGAHYTFTDHRTVRRVGKKAAGRRLDGREWNEFPAARECGTMTGDDYVTVTTVLRAVREKSIYVDRRLGGRPGDDVCISRSLLFGGDDFKVAERGIGCEVKFRIRRWKADELGLLEDTDKGQGRLFG